MIHLHNFNQNSINKLQLKEQCRHGVALSIVLVRVYVDSLWANGRSRRPVV